MVISSSNSVEHKDTKKSNEMYYPWFTKVIIHHFMSKDPYIPRRNKVNWYYVRDDHMFSTIKLVSRQQNTQQFGALLPIELTNEDIGNYNAYKEYYAVAIGATPPKPKASVQKSRCSSDTTITPPTADAGPRLTTSKKGKQAAKASKAKSLSALSKVAMTKAQQLKLATKRSLQQTHISQASGSGADEGPSTLPGVPDVPTDESEEDISCKSTDDEGDDDDQEDEGNDEDDKEEGSDDRQASDEEEFIHPSLSTQAEEETRNEECFDPIPKTPENSDDEDNGEENLGINVDNDEFLKTIDENMQKIIKEQVKEQVKKMKGNKSIHRSNKKRNLYKALVDAYESNKIILDTYGDTVTLKRRRDDDVDKDKEPSVGPDRGSTQGSKSRQTSASESAIAEEPMHTNFEMEESTHPEFAIGVDDQPIIESSQHPELFTQHEKPPTSDPGPTYELMKGSCKSLVELEYRLEEVYKATTNQLDWVNPEGQQYPHNLLKPLPLIPNNRGHRVIPFDHFINNDLEYLRGGALSRKYTTFVTKTKAAYYGHIKWIEDLVPRKMWIQEPIGYDKHAFLGISHWGVNVNNSMVLLSIGSLLAMCILSEESLLSLNSRLGDDKLYKFKEGDFKRLRIQDIEDMLLLLVQGKLTNLPVEECFAFNVSLRMFTRSIVIQRRVEDLQLGVESYQKNLNLTKLDTYRSDLKRKEAYIAYSNPRGFIYQNKDKKNRKLKNGGEATQESLFSLKFNYAGCFTESPVHELKDMVKKICFSGKTMMYYSFLKPDLNLDNGLYAFGNDEDVRRIAEYIRLDSEPVDARNATNECFGKGKWVALDDDQIHVEADNTMDNEIDDGNSDRDSRNSSKHDELVDAYNELVDVEVNMDHFDRTNAKTMGNNDTPEFNADEDFDICMNVIDTKEFESASDEDGIEKIRS
nr:hypothetical protein [Tanacetum cinerariifolium]